MVAEKLIDLIIRNRLMDKIVSYDQIQEMVKQIRSMRNGFVTNFYWDDKKHPYWIKEGTLLYDAKPDSFLLIHTADGFANLYYIANSIDIALCHFEEIKHEFDIVVDVVSKGKSNDIIDRFKRNGFEPYKSLFRMTHSGLMLVEEWSVDKIVIPATKEDIGEIRNCLYKGFDPLAEQLPSYQELSDFIDHDEILVVKDHEAICGFIIFEIIGVTWYLRYWYTSSDYRNKGVGAKLLKASLIKGKETKRQILWVMSNNENAIKRYNHYGFERELMNDNILIKRI